MRIHRILLCLGIFCISCLSFGQIPAELRKDFGDRAQKDILTREYITAKRIVWISDSTETFIKNPAILTQKGPGQATLNNNRVCILKSTQTKPGVLLDFGKEIHGGVQIITGIYKKNIPVRIRLRFGESASEAMAEIGGVHNATNDHAIRDFTISVPRNGSIQVGNTGFRFIRLDLLDDSAEVHLKEIRAVFVYRDLPYLGSFRCNDERLNQIWLTGAYTVHLNIQDYIWDGIKRDRLIWIGDMHPEVMTIRSVFGNIDAVEKSLDLTRDITPLPKYMNGISSYSMWWILLQREWYQYQGNLTYLTEQKEYLIKLLDLLMTKIDDNNQEKLDGMRFLDWPSSENKQAVHAGLHSLLIMTLRAGAELCNILKEPAEATKCFDAVSRLQKYIPAHSNSKQAAALMALAGIMDPVKANNEVIAVDGIRNFSTFYGYYMLQAKALAGDYQGAMDDIRNYWGAMLDIGATTFWEDFTVADTTHASRIDELVPPGKKDIHGDFGAYCYIGYRRSLCHGWASGPTPWLTEHVLGVKVTEPGCKTVVLDPHLGNLTWVEGSFPTPMGVLHIKHQKLENGKIKTTYIAPQGIKVIVAGQ